MTIGDKYTDAGGAVRIITDIVNDGPGGPEEVGYRIEGVPGRETTINVNGKDIVEVQWRKVFTSGKNFAEECGV